MKIRAAVLAEMGRPAPYADSKPLAIEEVELDSPGQGEVLIEIKAAGLCHSDLSVINGDRPRPIPMALGHEASGVVVERGPGVTDLAKGDHVVLVFVPSCGHCLPCMEGRPALCEPGAATNTAGTLASGARRLSRAGAPIHHHLGVSAFAEHAVVSRNSCIRIDPELPFDEAALFGCAVLTGVGAVINTAGVVAGDTVACWDSVALALTRCSRRTRLAHATLSRSTCMKTSSTSHASLARRRPSTPARRMRFSR